MLSFYLSMLETEEEKSVFEALYIKYKSVMYNVAYSILKDVQRSEDAVHEAFLSVLRNIDKISVPDCIQNRNYLIIIVRNAALTIYNKNKKYIVTDDVPDEISGFDEVEADVESDDMKRRIFLMLKEMNSNYGDVLMLKYFYDMSDKDIAEALGITLSNEKARAHRGKLILQKKIMEGRYDK